MGTKDRVLAGALGVVVFEWEWKGDCTREQSVRIRVILECAGQPPPIKVDKTTVGCSDDWRDLDKVKENSRSRTTRSPSCKRSRPLRVSLSRAQRASRWAGIDLDGVRVAAS